MIPVSSEYRRQLISGNRKWLVKVNMTLADGTLLNLNNESIWEGGITIDEAISSDSSFDIGAAVIGSLQVVIDNITGNYSTYDFYDAKLVLWLGVEGDVDEFDVQRYYRKGFYVVDKPTYNGSLITLECLDNMVWFDVPFDEVTGITYPATAGTVVQAICSHVGVTLGTPTFPNYSSVDTTITKKPEQKLNCREVLQYIAQMCCCYCKISTAGQLTLKWYDKNAIIGHTDYDGGTYNTTTTPYSDGCDLDGGHFMYGGDVADGGLFTDLLDTAYISSNFQIEVSTDDVVVTGCRVKNDTSKDNPFDELWVDPDIEQDHERYVLVIDNNPFILTQTQAANIANTIGNTLAGLPIRGFQASALSDFSYETGDLAVVIDFRGNRYYTWLTSFTFTTSISEDFSCGVESLRTRSSQRFSGTVKTLAEANANAEEILTAYDNAVKAMDELAQNAIGYNEYVVGSGGSKIMYRYNGTSHTADNPPKFPGSTSVFKISGDGVFVALAANGDIDPDGTCRFSNGYDANSGTAILNLIYAQGLNAQWITAGQISADRLTANVITSINNATGSTTINGGKITTGSITASKISVSNLQSISANIGGWTIDSNGFTNNHNSWVTPMEIGCGNYGSTYVGMRGKSGGDSSGYLEVAVNSSDDYIHVRYNGITKKNNGVEQYAQFSSSDRRFKKNIKNLTLKEAKDLISKATPRKFEFKSEQGTRYGFIAQELREVLSDDNAIEYGEDFRAIHYEDFIAPLCVMVNKQQEEIDLLKQELAELKARIK